MKRERERKRDSCTVYVLTLTMRPASAEAHCAATALVSGVWWSCQAKATQAASAHIIYPLQPHSPQGDCALITLPPPSAAVIGLLSDVLHGRRMGHASLRTSLLPHTHIYEPLCTRTQNTQIRIKAPKRITPLYVFAWCVCVVCVSRNSLVAQRHYSGTH